MTTLETLAENYRQHRDRSPLPADTEAMDQLRTMTPHSVTSAGILFFDCVSYEKGKRLHWHAFKVGPILFVKLSTAEEFAEAVPA